MTKTDKRFDITVSNDNTVRLIDCKKSNDLISIGFKEHSNASDCSDALQYLCNLMNGLAEENEQLKQSYKEFEDECQSTFNAMNRTQNVLYHKNFKLKEENEQLKQHNIELINKIDFLERIIDGDVE